MVIVAHLDISDTASLGKTCWNIYCRLQPSILEYNIQYQNSSLLQPAAKDNDYPRAELMLLYGANVNTFLGGKTPLVTAIQHRSIDVLEILLSHKKINLRMQNREGEMP